MPNNQRREKIRCNGSGEQINITDCVPSFLQRSKPCLFNGGCRGGGGTWLSCSPSVRGRVFTFIEVSLPDRSGGVLTVTAEEPLGLLGSVITTHMKRRRGEDKKTGGREYRASELLCSRLAGRENIYTHACTHARTKIMDKSIQLKKQGWESPSGQLPPRNSCFGGCERAKIKNKTRDLCGALCLFLQVGLLQFPGPGVYKQWK